MTYVPYHQDGHLFDGHLFDGHLFDGHLVRSGARPYDCLTGEDELSQVVTPIGVSREAEVSGLLDFPHMNDSADLNLVPWMNLPRRARHRNEQARQFRH